MLTFQANDYRWFIHSSVHPYPRLSECRLLAAVTGASARSQSGGCVRTSLPGPTISRLNLVGGIGAAAETGPKPKPGASTRRGRGHVGTGSLDWASSSKFSSRRPRHSGPTLARTDSSL